MVLDDNPPEYNADSAGTRVEAPKIFVPLLLVGSVFCFYYFTLAPTLLWGDNAYFQRSAFERILRPDAGGHWLWFQFAQLFVWLGWGDIALPDHTPYETIIYLRNVEGVRRDVDLVLVTQEDSLTPLAEDILPGGTLFLADDDPRYYDLESLADFCVVPFGPIYQIIEAQPSSACP